MRRARTALAELSRSGDTAKHIPCATIAPLRRGRPDETYVAHIAEDLVDLGEVRMNYTTLGDASSPALLLIPALGHQRS